MAEVLLRLLEVLKELDLLLLLLQQPTMCLE
jgi:hypothetical protein